MRIKPAPGTYVVTIEGQESVVLVTTDGMTSMVKVFVFMVECVWEWFELPPDGPALMPTGGVAIQFVGFSADGTVDVVFPDGSGKVGTYAHA